MHLRHVDGITTGRVIVTAVLDGTRSVVHDAGGISERVREGDPLCGWEGDPTYTLYYRRGSDEPYQVWATNGVGQPYLVLTAERCDHRILRRLRDSHWSQARSKNLEFRDLLNVQEAERQDYARELDREGMAQIGHALAEHTYTWGYTGGGDRRATRRLPS